MKKPLLTFLLFTLILSFLGGPKEARSQTMKPGRSDWLDVGSSNGATIQLRFRIRDNVCSSGRSHRFEVRVQNPEQLRDRYVTFSIYYLDCATGNTMEFTKSIDKNEFDNSSSIYAPMDYEISASEIFFNQIKAEGSSSQKNRVGKVQAFESKKASGIAGPDKSNAGETITLTVQGGQLGQGATWTWYENICDGTVLGTGNSISVSPTANTTYHVKPAGGVNDVNCVSKTIIVNTDPAMANRIVGPIEVCEGKAIQLRAEGGFAPPGYQWVWYEGRTKVGEGAFLNVAPDKNTTYKMRLEGQGLNERYLEHTVAIIGRSTDPTSASVSKTAICEGSEVRLTLTGGRLAEDAEWVWYKAKSNYGTKDRIGSGNNLSYAPKESAYFFVRAEGSCNSTDYVRTDKVEVTNTSTAPYSIIGPNSVGKNTNFTLSLRGGDLAQDAEWVWKRNGKEIYRGAKRNLSQTLTSKANYEVYAEGSCGRTQSVELQVDVVKVKRVARYQYMQGGKGSYKNIMHFQMAIGSFFQYRQHQLPEFSGFQSLSTGGSGFLTRIELHPYMAEYASIGFSSTLVYGLPFMSAVYDEDVRDASITYRGADLRLEVGLGYRNLKLLGIFTRSYHAWDMQYERALTERHSFTELRDGFNTGIRLFFPFNSSYTKQKIFDITANFYTASSLYPTGESSVIDRLGYLFTDPIDINPLNVGVQARLWFPSVWTIGLEYLPNAGSPRLVETGPRVMLHTTFQLDVFK